MPPRRCLAVAACIAALVAPCCAGVQPTAFVSADVHHGSANNGATGQTPALTSDSFTTFSFHLSEVSGGTPTCTGTPTHTSLVGTMTGALTLDEDASLLPNFYAGWTVVVTGTGAGTTTVTAYNALTRVITAASLGSTALGSGYTLTAGTCTAQAAARATLGTANMWSNCPEGCVFVGPIVNPEGYRAFISGPLACTTVTPGPSGFNNEIAVKCPKNTVAADSKLPTVISIKRQSVTLAAALSAHAVGQSVEIQNTVESGTMSAALTLGSSTGAGTANYYVGWKIETEFPKASGTILTYSSGNVASVAWDSPTACDTGFNKNLETCQTIVTTTATTYTLTADCPAAPLYTPLVITTFDTQTYQFAPGSLTSWEPILADPFTHDFVKCTVARSIDGLYSALVPAGAFTDAGGNQNTESTACRGLTAGVITAFGDGADAPTVIETAAGVALCNIVGPHMVTTDVTAPTVTATASDDNWMTSLSTGALANGDRITFKLVLSEPLIKTDAALALSLPGGTVTDGDVTTGHKCSNPKSWGSGTVYYLRCNAIGDVTLVTVATTRTISIEFAITKFSDLAGTVNTAMAAFTIISDNQSPNVITSALDSGSVALLHGAFTNLVTTFSFTLADEIMVGTTSTDTTDATLVPTAVTQTQYPYTIIAPGDWTAHHATDGSGIMHSKGTTNCGGGTFTIGAGSNLVPTMACPLVGVDWIVEEMPLATMVVSTRTITLSAAITAPTVIDDGTTGGGAGQTFQLIARYQTGTLGGVVSDLVVTLPTNYALPTAALGSTGGTTDATTADFYVGWTIETESPTGNGVVVDYDETNKQATIEWETIVSVTTTTTYKLTAPCSATPLYTDLVVESVGASPFTTVVFREGFAPTARTTDATGVAAVAAGPDRGIHGVDNDANFAIECALMRPANREITAFVPAGQFSDAAGNPNTASDPFIITQDETVPFGVITVSDASGNLLAPSASTGSRAVIFKIKLTEHVVSVGTTSGAGLNGMLVADLTVTCTNGKFWGWKDTYYLRCDWTNGQTASVALDINKVKDLAANQNAAVTAVTATFT